MSARKIPAQPGFYGLQYNPKTRKHVEVAIVAWEYFDDGSNSNRPTAAIYVGPEIRGDFMAITTIMFPDGSLYDPLTNSRYQNFNAWLSVQLTEIEINIGGVEKDGYALFGELTELQVTNTLLQVTLTDSPEMHRALINRQLRSEAGVDSYRITKREDFTEKGVTKTILFLVKK